MAEYVRGKERVMEVSTERGSTRVGKFDVKMMIETEEISWCASGFAAWNKSFYFLVIDSWVVNS